MDGTTDRQKDRKKIVIRTEEEYTSGKMDRWTNGEWLDGQMDR